MTILSFDDIELQRRLDAGNNIHGVLDESNRELAYFDTKKTIAYPEMEICE